MIMTINHGCQMSPAHHAHRGYASHPWLNGSYSGSSDSDDTVHAGVVWQFVDVPTTASDVRPDTQPCDYCCAHTEIVRVPTAGDTHRSNFLESVDRVGSRGPQKASDEPAAGWDVDAGWIGSSGADDKLFVPRCPASRLSRVGHLSR